MASLSEFEKTLERRPDLLENYDLTPEEEKMLEQIKQEESGTEIGNSLEFDFVVSPPQS